MTDTVWAAIVGGIAGVVTGSISALIAPWANWCIEKRRENLAHKRKLIANARTMIAEIAKAQAGSRLQLLERREEFHAIKKHLSEPLIKELYRPQTIKFGSTTIDSALTFFADELSELERKWKLV
jgi:hypothetical protein